MKMFSLPVRANYYFKDEMETNLFWSTLQYLVYKVLCYF